MKGPPLAQWTSLTGGGSDHFTGNKQEPKLQQMTDPRSRRRPRRDVPQHGDPQRGPQRGRGPTDLRRRRGVRGARARLAQLDALSGALALALARRPVHRRADLDHLRASASRTSTRQFTGADAADQERHAARLRAVPHRRPARQPQGAEHLHRRAARRHRRAGVEEPRPLRARAEEPRRRVSHRLPRQRTGHPAAGRAGGAARARTWRSRRTTRR